MAHVRRGIAPTKTPRGLGKRRVSMYVCIYVYICVCIYIYIYRLYMCACVHVCIYGRQYACMYGLSPTTICLRGAEVRITNAYTLIHIYIHTFFHSRDFTHLDDVWWYTCDNWREKLCIHTHTHTCIHKYTYIHSFTAGISLTWTMYGGTRAIIGGKMSGAARENTCMQANPRNISGYV
jgi:hypothetical protein